MKKVRPLFLEVTKDRYELPVAVADSIGELARMRRVDKTSISHALHKRGKTKSKYRVVWI